MYGKDGYVWKTETMKKAKMSRTNREGGQPHYSNGEMPSAKPN